jgi:tRNA A-37 threonylcarbamoyl transferase component Bud32
LSRLAVGIAPAPAVSPPPFVAAPHANAPQFTSFAIGETTWRVRSEYRDLLFDAAGFRLPAWRADGSATLVKAGAGRTIHRVRVGGAELYVKHFRPVKWFSLIHQFVRRGRARKEFEVAQFLRLHGVPTFDPLALGERRRAGLLLESYLVSESIAGGMTLFDFIEEDRDGVAADLRRRLAAELARLAARLHEAGVEHRDLHERNIVIRPTLGAEELFLLDLHELRRRPGREWRFAERDLARMGRYFTLRTSAADRLRFFRAYADERRFGDADERAKRMEARVQRSRAEFWRRRDARGPAKYNRLLEHRLPGVRAWSAPELPESFVERLMKNPDEPFRSCLVKWWKQGRSTRVAEIDLPEIRLGEPFVYKQYFFKGWHESLATVVRANQAERAWSNAAALLLRELPTPRPILLIHRTAFGLPVSSYLLCERVPGGMGLRDYLLAALAKSADAEARRRIVRGVVERMARLLRTMHERRVTHRDLKASNVLASATADPAAPDLWLIDLDGVSTWKTPPEAARVQNLARINVSFVKSREITRTERLRFLRIYLGRRFADRAVWKDLWRKIAADTDAKIRRNLGRGRAIQ